MAQFPILYSKATPTARTGNAEAHFNVDTGAAAIGQSVANIGKKLLAISLDIQAKDNASQLSNIDRMIKENHNAEYKALQETSDPDARIKIRDKAIQDRANIVNSSKIQAVARMAQDRLNNYEPQFEENFIRLDGKMRQEKRMDDLKLNVASGVARGDYESVKQAVSLAVGTADITDSAGELMLMEAKKGIAIQQISTLKIQGQFDAAIELAQKSNLDPKTENELITNIENARTHQQNLLKQKGNEIEVKNYEIGIKALVDSTTKPVENLPDIIENLNLPDDSKKKQASTTPKPRFRNWLKSLMEIQKSGKEPVSTRKGSDAMMDVIIKSNNNQLLKKEAYNQLMDLWLTDKSISKQELEYAYNRVNNPYDNTVFKTLEATIKDNRENYHGWWKSGNEADVENKVNMRLIDYVDKQLEINPKKVFEPIELQKISAQYRAEENALVSEYGTVDPTFGAEKLKIGDKTTYNGTTYIFNGREWQSE